MNDFKYLFEPVRIGTVEIKNRFVMSPMGTNLASSDGRPSPTLIDHYVARAQGGVGLIITEDTTIGPKYLLNNLMLNEDRFIKGWENLARSVHAFGAKIAPQLVHPGFNARSSFTGVQCVSASPIASRTVREMPRELAVNEIEQIVEQFGLAAVRAQKAGCDAVFLHCAHCYHLLGCFLSPLHNKRTDSYGGTVEGRLKLPLDVVERIRAKVGPDFPIIIRISGAEFEAGGRTLEESRFIAPLLVRAGVSAIQISAGTLNFPWFTTPPMGTLLAPYAFMTEAIKEVVDVPVICGGRMTNPLIAEQTLASRKADMIAMGRALLADPNLPNKTLAGQREDIIPCVGDLHCLANVVSGRTIRCLTNSTVGHEKVMEIIPTQNPKKVLVVGGGPSGLEAARVAAMRGHRVTLMEKTGKLGGQLLMACIPPLKQEMTYIIQYLTSQINKLDLEVKLNQEATLKTIEQLDPDVVIIATGASPFVPDQFSEINNNRVVTAWDILQGKVLAGPRIIIVGGGKVGCEVADFLAHPVNNKNPIGNRVAIVEILDHIASEERSSARSLLIERLREKGVEIITSAKVSVILRDGVRYIKDGREETIASVDTVVLATGAKPNDKLYSKLKDLAIQTYVIGDASEPRSAVEAIAEGSEVARKI